MELRKLNYTYPAMPKDKRGSVMSAHSICSIAPASEPSDYLYTGNGHHRIDVAGRPFDEEIVVTEEQCYEPLWDSTPTPPDLRPVIDEIRKAVLAGDPDTADLLIDRAQREAGFDKLMNMDAQIVYPVGSPHVHKAFTLNITRTEVPVENYLRVLDLDTGKVTVTYETADGVFDHSVIPAFDGNFVLAEFHAPAGLLDLTLDMKLPGGPNMFGQPTMVGADHRLEQTTDEFALAWRYAPEKGHKGYGAILRFFAKGGTTALSDGKLVVSGGTSLKVLAKVFPYRKDYAYGKEQPDFEGFRKVTADLSSVTASNLAILGEKMDRSRLTLGDPADLYLSGEELLQKCCADEELYPAMMDRLYDMGRFYQIIDTGVIPPMWGQHNINTNLQVCAGNNTGLFDEMDVYFRYYETKFEDFRTNARLLFNARGLLASVHCDIDSGLYYHFSRTYPHYCFTGVLGWVLNEFWGYYLCTGDIDFLRDRLVPALEETVLFFMDYSKIYGDDGHRIFVPSFSPEDPTPNPDYMTVTCSDRHATRINSVMDIAICREVTENLITALETLGIKTEDIPMYKAFLEELPVYLADPDGGLKEWAWPALEENYNHRHVSHHYDLWPGRAVTVDKEPEMAEAIRISNRKRGQQDDSAHGIIHRAFSAIRLKDREEAVQNLSQLICHGFVRRNLSTAHFPYRGQFPDLQGAMPALLLEMCVYSEPGMIEFLPCLSENFRTGRLEGIWLYTETKLESLVWDEDTAKAVLVPMKDQTLKLVSRREGAVIEVNGVTVATDKGVAVIEAKKDQALQVVLK